MAKKEHEIFLCSILCISWYYQYFYLTILAESYFLKSWTKEVHLSNISRLLKTMRNLDCCAKWKCRNKSVNVFFIYLFLKHVTNKLEFVAESKSLKTVTHSFDSQILEKGQNSNFLPLQIHPPVQRIWKTVVEDLSFLCLECELIGLRMWTYRFKTPSFTIP